MSEGLPKTPLLSGSLGVSKKQSQPLRVGKLGSGALSRPSPALLSLSPTHTSSDPHVTPHKDLPMQSSMEQGCLVVIPLPLSFWGCPDGPPPLIFVF